MEVTFGADAFEEDTDVCIEWLEPPVDPRGSLPDTTFRLTPENLELEAPVEYKILYQEEELVGRGDERNLRIHVLDGGTWRVDEAAQLNPTWGIATSESAQSGVRSLRLLDDPAPPPDAGMDASDSDAERSDATDTADSDIGDEDAATAGCSCVGDACPESVRPRTSATAMVQGGTDLTSTVDADVLETVVLTAQGSSAGDLPESDLMFDWAIVEKPAASMQSLLPGNTVRDPRLFLDVPGEYIVELRLTASYGDGEVACSNADRVFITAAPRADLYVSMTTETPDDPDPTDNEGTAVTLHYLHPRGLWESAPWDCFWNNTNPDWGATGDGSDDPEMLPGRVGSASPAVVRHSNHEDLIYQLGAYYLSSNVAGVGDVSTYATIRVYINGQLVSETTEVAFDSQGDFLRAGRLDGETLEYTNVGEMLDGFPSD